MKYDSIIKKINRHKHTLDLQDFVDYVHLNYTINENHESVRRYGSYDFGNDAIELCTNRIKDKLYAMHLVLFHELAHATGHITRKFRKTMIRYYLKVATNREKIQEEVIAEFTSLILLKKTGLQILDEYVLHIELSEKRFNYKLNSKQIETCYQIAKMTVDYIIDQYKSKNNTIETKHIKKTFENITRLYFGNTKKCYGSALNIRKTFKQNRKAQIVLKQIDNKPEIIHLKNSIHSYVDIIKLKNNKIFFGYEQKYFNTGNYYQLLFMKIAENAAKQSKINKNERYIISLIISFMFCHLCNLEKSTKMLSDNIMFNLKLYKPSKNNDLLKGLIKVMKRLKFHSSANSFSQIS